MAGTVFPLLAYALVATLAQHNQLQAAPKPGVKCMKMFLRTFPCSILLVAMTSYAQEGCENM